MHFIVRLARFVQSPGPVLIKSIAERQYHSREFLGISDFVRAGEKIRNYPHFKIESIRQKLQRSVRENDTRTLCDDLKTFLYTASSPNDLNLVIESLKKYNSKLKPDRNPYQFGPQLLRWLLFVVNQTDKVLELYFDDTTEWLSKSLLINYRLLMNKLYEEQRYDDMIRVYVRCVGLIEGGIANPHIEKYAGLYFDALVELNTPDAYQLAKQHIDSLNEHRINVSSRNLGKYFLIALNQNDPESAYRIASEMQAPLNLIKNLQIIANCRLGLDKKVLVDATELVNKAGREEKIFFRETVKELNKLYHSGNWDEQSKRELASVIEASTKRIFVTDLKTSLMLSKLTNTSRDNSRSNSRHVSIKDQRDLSQDTEGSYESYIDYKTLKKWNRRN